MPAIPGASASGLAPVLTPQGRLLLAPSDDAPVLAADLALRLVTAFDRGAGHGLLQLGAGEIGTALPPLLGYWRELGARFVTAVCAQPDIEERRTKTDRPDLPAEEQAAFAGAAPPMTGAEYLRLGDRAPLG